MRSEQEIRFELNRVQNSEWQNKDMQATIMAALAWALGDID